VWKECNNRIFKNKSSSTQGIVAQILNQLREIVKVSMKQPPNKPPIQRDILILEQLGLQAYDTTYNNKKARQRTENKAF